MSFINELAHVHALRWMGLVDSFDPLIVGNLLKLCKSLNYLSTHSQEKAESSRSLKLNIILKVFKLLLEFGLLLKQVHLKHGHLMESME